MKIITHRGYNLWLQTVVMILFVFVALPATAGERLIQRIDKAQSAVDRSEDRALLKPEESAVTHRIPEASVPTDAGAAAFDVYWTSLNGGGATSTGSTNYSWDATVGQGLAGSSASTNWSWDVGFWFSDAVGGACLAALAGDVNLTGSVNSTDIIVLVNYVLKGGPLPEPCEANGDVNCNGSVNSTDIIYLVNYVLKAGPLPCDICNDSPLSCT